jgi:hypothetical protein
MFKLASYGECSFTQNVSEVLCMLTLNFLNLQFTYIRETVIVFLKLQ